MREPPLNVDVYRDYGSVWVEVSRDVGHGGPGWEFGTCLWSPVTNASGRHRYKVMKEAKRGDAVLHFRVEPNSEMALRGLSRVVAPASITRREPPDAGRWTGREEYYRIDLRNYQAFGRALPLRTLLEEYGDEIRREILGDRPKFYPITTHGQKLRTIQGIYLARCTPRLFDVIQRALALELGGAGESDDDSHRKYQEERRRVGESQMFARNPNLIKAAKQRAANRCELCGLNTDQLDPEIGARVLECHHLDQLADQPGDCAETRLDEVLVVCANCHRLLHAKRPPFVPDVLRARMAAASQVACKR